MNNINDLSALMAFQKKAQTMVGELALCSLSCRLWPNGLVLVIDAPVQFVEDCLWEHREALKKAARGSDFKFILILVEGRGTSPAFPIY